MRLPYHDNFIELDDTWALAATRLGMTNFALAEDGFSETLCENRPPEPFEKRLSAIYFWRAENGEAYIGKAVDVQSRLRQHYKNHRDLVCAAFIPVAPEALDREERRLVTLAETEFRMRNVKLVKDSVSFRPLDEFLSVEQQSAFVETGNPHAWLGGDRREFPMLESRSRVKLSKFREDAELCSDLQVVVSEFVQAAIPMPNGTENRFWSVTYLGYDNALLRINAGQQEVFTVVEDDDGFWFRLVCPTKLSKDFDGLHYETNSYASYFDWDGAARLFASAKKMRPMREFVVWLARHTTPLNNRSHCPWLYVPEVTDRWKKTK